MSKVQKIALAILAVAFLAFSYNFIFRRGYNLYILSKNIDYKSNTVVKRNGVDIGKVSQINYIDDTTVLLKLRINGDEKIPVNSRERYSESIFGDGIYSFEYYENIKAKFYKPNDTISSINITINNQDTLYRIIKNGIENLNNKFDSLTKDTVSPK